MTKSTASAADQSQWLLLVFSLPTSKSSERVEIWRSLRKTGALSLKSAGHVLPNTPANEERFEWLAKRIRKYRGHATVVVAQSFDEEPTSALQQRFVEQVNTEYELLSKEIRKTLGRSSAAPASVSRLRKKLDDISERDFFDSPLRSRLAAYLAHVESSDGRQKQPAADLQEFSNRVWITRPRPGIDRVSSAWLIRRFIDEKATFTFGKDHTKTPNAVPFDMFTDKGFGHEGDDCTFETLIRRFRLKDPKLKVIAEVIHDADLRDEKFARTEAMAIDAILVGWANQGTADEELLQRGMEMIEGLYHSL